MTRIPTRQDYTTIDTSGPVLDLTVLIPARDSGNGSGQGKLDIVLAALAAQEYPAQLHVIVVDDASPVPLRLPRLAPRSTRLITLADDAGHWGKSRAVNTALAEVTTDLVMSLDADMVLHPDHLRAMAAWASACPLAVVLGWKRMTDSWVDDTARVHELCATGRFEEIATGPHTPHAWLEDLADSTGDLTAAGPDVFRAVVGASVLMRTDLLRRVGGYDEDMRTAEDTELGYRLVTAGAIVIPERRALAWHLGTTSMEQHKDIILAHNQALLAPRVPLLEYLRRPFPARTWTVPTAVVNVTVDESNARHARVLVNDILAGRLGVDARIVLVGAWPGPGRYAVTDDPQAAMRALADSVTGEPRVRLADTPELDTYPSAYRVDVPGHAGANAARTLLATLRTGDHGVVAAAGSGTGPAQAAAWLTAAWNRARANGMPDDSTGVAAVKHVGRTWSPWWVDAATLDLDAASRALTASLVQQPGTPLRAYASTAWSSWGSAGYSWRSGRTIAGGLVRGARRRLRRARAAART